MKATSPTGSRRLVAQKQQALRAFWWRKSNKPYGLYRARFASSSPTIKTRSW